MKRLSLVLLLAGCGRTMPTTPLAACPPVAANYAYTDTVYFLPATYQGVTLANRGPIAYIQTVYACGAVLKRKP
jgi:hypothetical protein